MCIQRADALMYEHMFPTLPAFKLHVELICARQKPKRPSIQSLKLSRLASLSSSTPDVFALLHLPYLFQSLQWVGDLEDQGLVSPLVHYSGR